MHVFKNRWKRSYLWDISSILLLTCTTQDKALSSGQSSTLTFCRGWEADNQTERHISFLQEIQKTRHNPEYDKFASTPSQAHIPITCCVTRQRTDVWHIATTECWNRGMFIQIHRYDNPLVCMLRLNRTDSCRLFLKSLHWPFKHKLWNNFSTQMMIHDKSC